MTNANDKINYVELALSNVDSTTQFYSVVFGWEFQEWGPGYLSFSGSGVDGGFSGERKPSEVGTGPLVVLYADDIEAKLQAIRVTGCHICTETFDFPGGRRFHFTDPNGNEIAVWTKADPQ